MANEGSISFSFQAAKSGAQAQGSITFQFSMSGGNCAGPQTQDIGTSAEALTWGDAANVTYYAVKNLDSTNYVDISMASDGTSPFARLNPGEGCVLPGVSGQTVYAKAHTGACRIAKFYAET